MDATTTGSTDWRTARARLRPEVVREARRNRLAIASGESREEERRTLLASLWRQRTLGRPLATLP